MAEKGQKKPIFFVGFGGFAAEILAHWTDFDLSEHYVYAGFFDDDAGKQVLTGYHGSLSALQQLPAFTAVLLTATAPVFKASWADRSKATFTYPNAIHRRATMGARVKLGQGNIISEGCILTTDIQIGDFNVLNHYVTVGHHSQMGQGNALMTKAHLSGHVRLGNHNLLAVGSSILQGKGMGNGNTLGPHACLMNNAGDGQTYLGVPALAVK